MGSFGKTALEKRSLTMEFVAYKENLDSFLVKGIRLLVPRLCNTTLLVEYTSQLYLHHQASSCYGQIISAPVRASSRPIVVSRHG
jgi:hypothetical protein